MFNFIRNLLGKVEYRVIEIEKESRLPEVSGELRESVKTLQYHPGFQFLLRKLANERAMLQKYFNEGFQLTERELHHLQAGIHYLGWLDRELKTMLKIPAQAARSAYDQERAEFEKIHESLEPIGLSQ